jgi:hypothetical protein
MVARGRPAPASGSSAALKLSLCTRPADVLSGPYAIQRGEQAALNKCAHFK